MLSRFDDYPIHQTSHPLRVKATSNRHHYDRYWFNGYSADGTLYFGIAAAVYPNLGIVDCAFSIVHDGKQHSFHTSRRLTDEPTDLRIGPFQIEITEPMKALRVTIDDNETGIACDLRWIARTASFAEKHQQAPQDVGSVMEATRFNQFGFWDGSISFAGETLAIDPASTYGTKDRSWGIRPVGDPAPPGAPPTSLPSFFFLWAPLHWEDRCTHVGIFENRYGEMWHWDGMVVPVYDDPDDLPGVEDPDATPLAAVEDHIVYVPGTRRASHVDLKITHRGGREELIELEPLLCFRMKGIGYTHPEWGHGRWKGELTIEGEVWNCADLDTMQFDNQHIQQVVRARSGDAVGIGVVEQICLGPHDGYGFERSLDPA